MEAKETETVSQVTQLSKQLQAAQEELWTVRERLREIEDEKREMELAAERLRGRIEVLEPLCQEHEKQEDRQWADLAPFGIQECCYRVLFESEEPLDATLIRSRLEERNVDMKRYANPLAVIHTSLKRMIPDRVRSFKRHEEALTAGSKVWVRYYEAIRPTPMSGLVAK